MIEYFGKLIRPLVLIMPKINEYAKTLKVKNRDRDKHNKLMPFCTDDEMLLGKYKAIWTKIEDFKNFELNALTVYDRYIKTKIRTYSDKVYTNLRVYTKFHLLVKKLFLQDFNFAVEL